MKIYKKIDFCQKSKCKFKIKINKYHIKMKTHKFIVLQFLKN